MSDPVWVFFAAQAKLSSMRRALPDLISATQPVVIVDEPVSVVRRRSVPAFKLRWKRHTEKDLTFYRPLYLPVAVPGIGRVARVLNQLLLRREIDRLLPSGRRRIVCYDSPTQDYLVKKLGEDRSIYLAIDDRTLTVTGEPIRGELEAERRLLSKVDLVICVSDVLSGILKERCPPKQGPPIHVVPNGFDKKIFDTRQDYHEPDLLKVIPRPRVLIAGHISERIDWKGIRTASQLRPEWSWVFVGPADLGMDKKIHLELGDRGFLFPPVLATEVPSWIKHCDVCAIPYRLNSFTLASCPLKAFEYLAMGMPTLSTRVPALQKFNGEILWVEEGKGETYTAVLDRTMLQRTHMKSTGESNSHIEECSLDRRVETFQSLVSSFL